MQSQSAVSSRQCLGAAFVGLTMMASSVLAQRSLSPSVALLTSAIDLGRIAPGVSAATEPSLGNAVVRVTSDRYWQLSLIRHPDAGGEEVAVSSDGIEWTPLNPGLPVPLATGTATPREGVLVHASLRVSPTFDMPAGRRHYGFSVILNGQRIDPAIQCNVEIVPSVTYEEDGGRFAVTADRPSERRDYDFNPRIYTIRSNAPWVLEIAPQGSDPHPLPYVMETLDLSGSYKPLTRWIPVASGRATGRAGASVPVRLRLKLADVAVAGTYSTAINVRARIAMPIDNTASNGESRR